MASFCLFVQNHVCWHSLRLWLLRWRCCSSHLLITFIQREARSRIPVWGYFKSQFCLGLVAISTKQIEVFSPGIPWKVLSKPNQVLCVWNSFQPWTFWRGWNHLDLLHLAWFGSAQKTRTQKYWNTGEADWGSCSSQDCEVRKKFWMKPCPDIAFLFSWCGTQLPEQIPTPGGHSQCPQGPGRSHPAPYTRHAQLVPHHTQNLGRILSELPGWTELCRKLEQQSPHLPSSHCPAVQIWCNSGGISSFSPWTDASDSPWEMEPLIWKLPLTPELWIREVCRYRRGNKSFKGQKLHLLLCLKPESVKNRLRVKELGHFNCGFCEGRRIQSLNWYFAVHCS